MVPYAQKNVTLHHKTPASAPFLENLPPILSFTSANVFSLSMSAVMREQFIDSLAYDLDNHCTGRFASLNARAANLTFRYSWLFFLNPSLIWYIEGAEILLAAWVHGRIIQNIQVPPQSHAYYRVYWNGLDHDGDDRANGIYFYKIIAKSDGSATEVIQKLVKVR